MWMKEHKSGILQLIRNIIFLAGLAVILIGLNRVFVNKDAEIKYRPFYEEGEDYDILFTGISHMQMAISPMELWKEYGYASFNLAEAGSRMYSNYYVLKNALDYTNPKLVVIDVRRMDVNEHDFENYTERQFDLMPLGRTKVEAAVEMFDNWDQRLELLVPFIKYHGRWKDLMQRDWELDVYRLDKGASHYDDIVDSSVPMEYPSVDPSEKSQGGELSVRYLKKMIELCQERGIEVMLVEIPYPASEEDQRLANGVADIAEEYGVKYLNCLTEDGVVDLSTDMQDADSHLNDSGMKKFTSYLGRFISENYELPDRREDAAYASWFADYDAYTDYKLGMLDTQKELNRFGAYLILLADREMNSRIFVKEGSLLLQEPKYRRLIANLCWPEKPELLEQAAEEGQAYFLEVDNSTGTLQEYAGADAAEAWKSCGGAIQEKSDVQAMVSGAETGELLDSSDWQYIRDDRVVVLK